MGGRVSSVAVGTVVVLAVVVSLLGVAAFVRTEPAPSRVDGPSAVPTVTVSPDAGRGSDAASVVPADRCTSTRRRTVLVDLSEQHLWMCRGGSTVADAPVTTGRDRTPTPTGRWSVYALQTDRWLAGPGYSRLVDYWVPFFEGYGFHDSPWQKVPYGGQEHRKHGSHGCVHVPGGFMKRLHAWTKVGTSVRVVD